MKSVYKYKSNECFIKNYNLINLAYNFNPNFKNFDKEIVKHSFSLLVEKIKTKFFNTPFYIRNLQEIDNEVLSIISSLRLWNRKDLPMTFIFDTQFQIDSVNRKRKEIARLKNNINIFYDILPFCSDYDYYYN